MEIFLSSAVSGKETFEFSLIPDSPGHIAHLEDHLALRTVRAEFHDFWHPTPQSLSFFTSVASFSASLIGL